MGVAETAQALARLGREDICYVIAGGEPDASLREAMAQVQGLDVRWMGTQPYERTPEVVAMADACVLLQDEASPVAQFQLPAKLMDALGMGLTVFAQVTPPLKGFAEQGAIIPVTRENLVDRIRTWLLSGDSSVAEKGRAVFESELTGAAVAPIIRAIMADRSPRSAMTPSWDAQLERLFNSQLPSELASRSKL